MRTCWHEADPFPTDNRPRAPVEAAARSDRGKQRTNNEDRALLARVPSGALFGPPAHVRIDDGAAGLVAAVCDGMGGEAGGEIASGLAVEAIGTELVAAWKRLAIGSAPSAAAVDERLGRALVVAVDAASERVRDAASADLSLARMGTTATVALFGDGVLVCAQVGDSRAYVLRGKRLVQITRDQTVAEMLRARAPEPEPTVLGDHVVLQAVGSSPRLEVALTRTPVDAGDVVLLCSDGLSGVVDDDEIAAILRAHARPADACDALIARANALGGPDNVTCVVVRL